jgi:hypothetical protein
MWSGRQYILPVIASCRTQPTERSRAAMAAQLLKRGLAPPALAPDDVLLIESCPSTVSTPRACSSL